MAELQPIRKSGEGFPQDEVLYLERLSQAALPAELEPLRHTLDWPVDMTDPNAHITCFFGQPNYSASRSKRPHFALDIQLPLGTSVTTPEATGFTWVDLSWVNSQRKLSDIQLYSSVTRLTYQLAHLNSSSLHSKLTREQWSDRYKKVAFEKGMEIGQVGLFFNPSLADEMPEEGFVKGLHPLVEIPEEVEAFYGRTYNHLHFAIHYLPNIQKLHIDNRNPVDPLALLKRLY